MAAREKPAPGWLTIRDVSERTGLSVRVVTGLLRTDGPEHIPCNVYHKDDPRRKPSYRIRESDLEAWLNRHKS